MDTEKYFENSLVPKVSVIVAVYNAESFLEECMRSIVSQTLKDIEIICVDDGSTDASLEMLKRYQKHDDRIRIIHQENQGAGAARNHGMHAARGEYLSFLDADDFFEPTMLEEAYTHAAEENTDICVFAANVFEQDTGRKRPCTWAFRKQFFPVGEIFNPADLKYRDNLFRMFNGWAWDKLFKREFIRKKGIEFQNLRTTNDMFFVFFALANAKSIYAFERVLANQRINVNSSLSRTREKSWDCFYHALLLLQKKLQEEELYSIYKKAFLNWCLNFSLWQYNSIQGAMKEKVYFLLKYNVFTELHVAKYPKEIYYSTKEYQQMVKIITQGFTD